MGTVFAECWNCDQCSHKWLKGEIYPSHCAKCRSRKWDKDEKTSQPDKKQVQHAPVAEVVITETSTLPIHELPKSERMSIALAAMASVGKSEPVIAVEPEIVCGQISEYDQQTGERYICGKAPQLEKSMNRRNFLKLFATASAAAGLGVSGMSLTDPITSAGQYSIRYLEAFDVQQGIFIHRIDIINGDALKLEVPQSVHKGIAFHGVSNSQIESVVRTMGAEEAAILAILHNIPTVNEIRGVQW